MLVKVSVENFKSFDKAAELTFPQIKYEQMQITG